MDALTLAELLCARVCHDLSGPVGAAAAGAELVEDMGDAVDGETVALVATSAAGAAARLKFFRAALGPAASQPQPTAALRELIEAYLGTLVSAASPGIVVDWRVAAPALGGDAARLLLNLVLLAKDALPRGGRITVEAADGVPAVVALGEPASPTDEARAVLMDGAVPSGPRGAQAWFANLLAEGVGGGIEVAFTPAGLAFTARRRVTPPKDGSSRPDG